MKKRLFFLLVAVLAIFMASSAQAWFATEPKAANGSGQVSISVFNNAGAALDAGDVVIWDIGASTGDDDLYVTTTTTVETGLVAGVVWPNGISDGNTGTIVVYGQAQCDLITGIASSGLLCSSATAGSGRACTNAQYRYAIANTAAIVSGQAACFVIAN